MNKNYLTSIAILFSLSTTNIFSEEANNIEELKHVMVFDNTCIVMHREGRKYLQNKDRITQSLGATALLEQQLEVRLAEYLETTGEDSKNVRDMVSAEAEILFKELSEHQPRDLVKQCQNLVENIVRSNVD